MQKFFKIHQKVHDIIFGEGEVIATKNTTGPAAIEVKFPCGRTRNYYPDGTANLCETIQRLYQTAPIITLNQPIQEEFKDGELVFVSENRSGIWQLRFYAKYENQKHHCYDLQQKSGDSSPWQYIQKFQNNPLLPHSPLEMGQG